MVIFKQGNIFQSNAQVITNPINCVGVMGKGLALSFKNRFPRMFEDYQKRCHAGEVRLGRPYLWEDDKTQILNFPTKNHWKDHSHLDDIDRGLEYLAKNFSQMGISSIALPALGAGLGGLKRQDVMGLIEKHFATIDDLDVYVYENFDDHKTKEASEKYIATQPLARLKIAAQQELSFP